MLERLEYRRVEDDGLTTENVPNMLECRQRHRLRSERWWRGSTRLAAALSEGDVGFTGDIGFVGLRRSDGSGRYEFALQDGDAEVDRTAHRQTGSPHLGEVGKGVLGSGEGCGGRV